MKMVRLEVNIDVLKADITPEQVADIIRKAIHKVPYLTMQAIKEMK